MKLSQSQKNFGRVFLTCFKRENPCNYFQWIHWKVRQPKGPMDRYVRDLPDEGQRQDRILQEVRRDTRPARWGVDTSRPRRVNHEKTMYVHEDRLQKLKKEDVKTKIPTEYLPWGSQSKRYSIQYDVQQKNEYDYDKESRKPWPSHPRYAPDYDEKREKAKRVSRYGFSPSPDYDGKDFVRGLYVGNRAPRDYEEKSSYFVGSAGCQKLF